MGETWGIKSSGSSSLRGIQFGGKQTGQINVGGHRQMAPEIQNPEVASWLSRAVFWVHFQQVGPIFETT